jgi:hypothetical protein
MMPKKSWFPVIVLCAALSAGPTRAAVTEDNFLVRNASDLTALCSAAQSNPLYTAAVNFCHGFVVGVFLVLQEEEEAGPRVRLFCARGSMPTRTEAVASLVQWIGADQSRSTLSAADSVAAFLAQRYPCPASRQ